VKKNIALMCLKSRFCYEAPLAWNALCVARTSEKTLKSVGTSEKTLKSVGTSEKTLKSVGTSEKTPKSVGTSEKTLKSVGTSEKTPKSVGTSEKTLKSAASTAATSEHGGGGPGGMGDASDLESRVQLMEERWQELNSLPTNSEMFRRLDSYQRIQRRETMNQQARQLTDTFLLKLKLNFK